jgi:hypothetical protein
LIQCQKLASRRLILNISSLQELLASRFDRLEGLLCQGGAIPPPPTQISTAIEAASARPNSHREPAAAQQTLKLAGSSRVLAGQVHDTESTSRKNSTAELGKNIVVHTHDQALASLNLPLLRQPGETGNSNSNSNNGLVRGKQLLSDPSAISYSASLVFSNSEAEHEHNSVPRPQLSRGDQNAPGPLFSHNSGVLTLSDWELQRSRNEDDVSGGRESVGQHSTVNFAEAGSAGWSPGQARDGMGNPEYVGGIRSGFDGGPDYGGGGERRVEFIGEKIAQEAERDQTIAADFRASTVEYSPFAEKYGSHLDIFSTSVASFNLDGQSRNVDYSSDVVEGLVFVEGLEQTESLGGDDRVFCCPTPTSPVFPGEGRAMGNIDSLPEYKSVSVLGSDLGWAGADVGGDGGIQGCERVESVDSGGLSREGQDPVYPSQTSPAVVAIAGGAAIRGAAAGGVVTSDLPWIT